MYKKIFTIIILFLILLIPSYSFSSEVKAHFIRPADLKTVGQGVKVYLGKKYIGKFWHDNYGVIETKKGKHKIVTKVGLSVNLPVTGLGGAKKFKTKRILENSNHYFKIIFKKGKMMMPGKHEIIEITKDEYLSLKEKSGAKEIKYKDK